MPVAVGTAVAATVGEVRWVRAALALVVSLALQVGVNYANDYSDGVRGTDADRVGPPRMVAGALASARAVRNAAFTSFAVAGAAGAVLALATTPWLFAVGAASILAAWTYTGGPRPYGYAGFGECFVFAFFGVVAVVGTAYVVSEHVLALAWGASIPVGLLAVALLVVNNLRDIPGDTVAGKRTLAVRLGDARTRILYAALVIVALVGGVLIAVLPGATPWTALVVAAAPAARRPLLAVRGGATGRALVAVLGDTGRLQLLFGALLTVALVVGR